MRSKTLLKAIVDARKARLENGTGGEATFVSGDVTAGTVRSQEPDVIDESDARGARRRSRK